MAPVTSLSMAAVPVVRMLAASSLAVCSLLTLARTLPRLPIVQRAEDANVKVCCAAAAAAAAA